MNGAFRYRAATASGAMVEGTVQAPSAADAMVELRRQTLVPVLVEPQAPGRATRRARRAGSRDAVALASRTLATMIGAGIPLERALAFSAEHAGHPAVGAALADVRRRVLEGSSLAAALQSTPEFGSFAAAVARAGEESGTLDDALLRLAEHYERSRNLVAQVRNALLYPLLMSVVALVGVVVLLAFVVPRFVTMLGETGGTLPLSTRLLVSLSSAVTAWWWVWLPLVALTVAAVRQWVRDPGRRAAWHGWRLGLPVSGALEFSTCGARYTRALGTLLRSGSRMTTAMEIARTTVPNEALGGRLDAALESVRRGEPVAQALASSLPPLAVQLMRAGEESGRLDDMAVRAADTLDEDVQRSLKALVGLIEPVMIVTFGVIVGFIALAMLQAVYSINASML